jgi:hypothetical protein
MRKAVQGVAAVAPISEMPAGIEIVIGCSRKTPEGWNRSDESAAMVLREGVRGA